MINITKEENKIRRFFRKLEEKADKRRESRRDKSYYKSKCKKCGTKFTFEQEDSEIFYMFKKYHTKLECPKCKNTILQ